MIAAVGLVLAGIGYLIAPPTTPPTLTSAIFVAYHPFVPLGVVVFGLLHILAIHRFTSRRTVFVRKASSFALLAFWLFQALNYTYVSAHISSGITMAVLVPLWYAVARRDYRRNTGC